MDPVDGPDRSAVDPGAAGYCRPTIDPEEVRWPR
jgi:hypothetical protein